MSILNLTILVVSLFPVEPRHLIPNYFSYYDCQEACIIQNNSCLISFLENAFVRPCSGSFSNCESEYSPDMVCLRPNLPALGGENIWPLFRSQYYSNATDPESDEIRYRTKILLTSIAFNGLQFLLMLALATALLCIIKPCRRTNPEYQRLTASLPDSPENPYARSTTAPLHQPQHTPNPPSLNE